MRAQYENRAVSVFDPHRHKERYEAWDGTLSGVQESDAELILAYIQDMQDGVNVAGKRGKRSTTRLNTIRSRMAVLSRIISKHTGKNLVSASEEELLRVFARMRDGGIPREDGKPYKSVADYTISYKAFWHWYIKRQRKAGETLQDKTIDFDTSQEKPKFNYLTYEQVKQLADNAKPYYKMLVWFLFDAGCRAPTELMNIRVKDLQKQPDGSFQLDIRDETSKTFGRKIKLLLCSELLDNYLKVNDLKPNDRLFTISPGKTNEYLGRLSYRLFKIGIARTVTSTYTAKKGRERVLVEQNKTLVSDGLTMYDLRHASACYWLPRYKNESALKYRFGWKNSDMIHYYTEFLGMKDTITQDDLIDSEEKTRLQKELEQQKQQLAIMQEQMAAQQAMMQSFMDGKIAQAMKKYKNLEQ